MGERVTHMKIFTLFRFYLAVCTVAISTFTYAEYYGYVLTGSDENQRENLGGIRGSSHVNTIHHK